VLEDALDLDRDVAHDMNLADETFMAFVRISMAHNTYKDNLAPRDWRFLDEILSTRMKTSKE
jgi:hypothetical protein